ncbi:MAG: hypothetical protein IJT03_02100 [Clostridia bacterium]|nr:hypothetical protein [Clostridia bacterium]
MKSFKKITAVLLSVIFVFSFSVQSLAGGDASGEPYSGFAHVVDNAFGSIHDAIFGLAIRLTKMKDIPSREEYTPELYRGTDGAAEGPGWSGGFASASVIPTAWRCDAQGNPDPNGMCLKGIHATGGYQTYVSKIYTEQMLNLIILSNGSDTNGNGVGDIMIFISVDGVGVTSGTCLGMRAAMEKTLAESGVEKSDILSCNISATHCHAGLDTQGMSIPTLFLNKLNPFTDYDRSLNREMNDTLCARAAECAGRAYSSLEKGRLYFFETGKTSGCSDKLNFGANTKNFFSCFLFESAGGEKTLITNIGGHPTSYGAWDGNRMMCTDYPYFMAMALKDAGYNIVFTQSSQASVTSPNIDVHEGDRKDVRATECVKRHALSKEDWIERYGKKYADKWYDDLEESLEGHMKKGALLAGFILDSIDRSAPLSPTLNIRNTQTMLSLDYGVMALGSVSGLLGENVVRTEDSESGYGVMVDINYLEFGGRVAVITGPGELSPTLVYGTDPDYTGKSLWTGRTSWTGEDWSYDTLQDLVTEKTGKTLVFMGITNDALGYMYPDICTPESLLGTAIFYKENPGDMTNCMLMTVGTRCGSQLMDAFTGLLDSVSA